MTHMVALQTDFPFERSCAGCGKSLKDVKYPWQSDHFGMAIPGSPINDSANSALGVVLVWHCLDCDPKKTRIAFLRNELQRLEAGQYTPVSSAEWNFANGL
ncbi:hypothetical protein LCGC14_2120760 [marine sediment metagenome]|uniref:Uncharacterized protein n=1 Tax=marine sediment metagenome TaxID=412755 RepID=A0A0F9ERG8_9ZZZZ